MRAWLKKNFNFFEDVNTPQTWQDKTKTVMTAYVFQMFYIGGIIQILKAVFSSETLKKYIYWGWISNTDVPATLLSSLTASLGISIFFAVFLAPLWEELAFRAIWYWKKLRKREKEELYQKDFVEKHGKMPIWDFVLFCSIIFGIAHGGPLNILIQGVGGLFLSYVFLRNGRSYWSAVILHAMYNGTLILFAATGAWKDAVSAITMPHWLIFF